jgi:hypothetical protein
VTLPICRNCGGHTIREKVRNIAIPHYTCTDCGAVLAGLGTDLLPCADPDSHILDRFTVDQPFAHLPSTIQPGPDCRGLL